MRRVVRRAPLDEPPGDDEEDQYAAIDDDGRNDGRQRLIGGFDDLARLPREIDNADGGNGRACS